MRITGGIHRSRTIRAPRGDATRPTTDRVREALFSILQARGRVDGARVLDLYAGTGALALEALSRGAVRATLVESAKAAVAVIRENIAALDAGAIARVVAMPVERATAAIGEDAPYNLVFADPPYADVADAARAIGALARANFSGEECVVVLEHAGKSDAPAIAELTCEETRRYGDSAISIYCRA
jgi:16S rRNA (guanine966-N2)-methyltransferase